MVYKSAKDNSSNKKVNKIKSQQENINKDRELKELRQKIEREVDYTMDGSVKQLFLNLTKMQIPFDYEKTLEKYFPDDINKDVHGNYYIKIGDNKTMFCAHLDTYCYEYKKVWHVIKDGKVKTDGTTTLGGDDKAGVTILLKMIEAGIPGLYYFFRGEEGVTSPTGTWGSKQALKSYEDNFKKYEKCIAFDRRDNDSIISQQMYSICCSDDFVKSLSEQFKSQGLNYVDDSTGMWSDSGVFMELIPECTNISVGYKNEHTFNEEQDLEHLEKLVEACLQIDWDSLPVKRDPNDISQGIGNYHYDYSYKWDHSYSNGYKKKSKKNIGPREYVTMDEEFGHVVDILKYIGYEALNFDFEETEEMYFQNYDTGDFFGLRIIDYEIYISEDDSLKSYEHIGDLDNFEKYVSLGHTENEEEEEEEIDNLDKQLDRHLSSGESYSKTPSDNDFTYEQNTVFKKFVKKNKELVKNIMDDMVINNKIEINAQTWINIENAMYNSNIKLDYSHKGINPDDFVDWVSANWILCNDIITEYNEDKVSGTTITESESIFYDISLNQYPNEIEQFIKQVTSRGIINNENFKIYEKKIDIWLKNKYEKEFGSIINSKSFLEWLKKHQDDLLEYYKT